MRLRNEESFPRYLVLFLCIATSFIFLGRAWQHIFWDAPFRAIIWDPHYMGKILPWLTGMTWHELLTTQKASNAIDLSIRIAGFLYLVCGLSSIAYGYAYLRQGKRYKVFEYVIYVGFGALLLLVFMTFKEHFFRVGMLIEHTIHLTVPLFFIVSVRARMSKKRLLFLLKVSIALTFIGHGFFAHGITSNIDWWNHPVPGKFIDMTIKCLGITEPQCGIFLKIAGMMDFLVGIFIFLPEIGRIIAGNKKSALSNVLTAIGIFFLAYAAAWGFLTALARIWAYIDFLNLWSSLSRWWFETVFRFPHAMIPFVVLVLESPRLHALFSKKKEVSVPLSSQLNLD